MGWQPGWQNWTGRARTSRMGRAVRWLGLFSYCSLWIGMTIRGCGKPCAAPALRRVPLCLESTVPRVFPLFRSETLLIVAQSVCDLTGDVNGEFDLHRKLMAAHSGFWRG
jgi:hypothetical protein